MTAFYMRYLRSLLHVFVWVFFAIGADALMHDVERRSLIGFVAWSLNAWSLAMMCYWLLRFWGFTITITLTDGAA